MLENKTERAENIFYEAQLLTQASGRRSFVEKACMGDSGLLAEVEAMLSVHAEGERFFSESMPALESAPDLLKILTRGLEGQLRASETVIGEQLGSLVGPYKLLEKIGEGGCGSVYMAEQHEPVQRRVALKVIKLGMDTKSVIARFEAERRALAIMEHPSIARVLDAGMTGSGRPFFVMELVKGVPITEYCDTSKLNIRQRLELFIQVCNAIQHAHHKGIVHRDIKPSNILVEVVDGRPLPKVIDFGVAKAMEEKIDERTSLTFHGFFVGTPAYMSPEQAQISGMDIDTRSDVYSMGVLLYELLAGVTPFDAKDLLAAGIDEMRKTLQEKEPASPSHRIASFLPSELGRIASQRGVGSQQLQSDIKGDLDCIVLHAVEKDRNRRYQTASGFAADVRRFLDNEPISVRMPTRIYRLQKLFRRNRIVFAAAGFMTLALLAGSGFSTYMYFRERAARHEQARLREMADKALANEGTLRREAEARAKITQAAIHLSRGNSKQADDLVAKLSLPVIEPSLEAADAFRKLALWNVTQGNWNAAASRLLRLVEANQIDRTDMTDRATRDLLMVGPTLVLIGDIDGYNRFRRTVIARFSNTVDPVAAEQILKVTTLLPMSVDDAHLLQPLARTVEAAVPSAPSPGWETYLTAWRAFALTRYEYRRENHLRAIEWGERCLALKDPNPIRIVTCHAILAMAHYKLGRSELSKAELDTVRDLAAPQLAVSLDKGLPTTVENQVYWYDQIDALLLLNEAASEIEGRLPQSLLPELHH